MSSNQHTCFRKDFPQGFNTVNKHIPCTGSHKQFYTAHMFLVQLLQQLRIVIGCSEIKRIVYDTLVCSISKLVFQSFQSCCLRITVRHIHKRSYSPCCRSRSFTCHVSLMSQSRITKMYMIIYNSRDEVTTAGVDFGIARYRRANFSL